MRVTLVRIAAGEQLLLLTLHHIVADGWSMDILGRELGELYAATVTGRRAELPELPIQYADFAVWQRDWLTGERLEGQLDYWRGTLDRAADPGASDRPAPAGVPDLSRGGPARGAVPRPHRRAARAGARRGLHPVHDAARRLRRSPFASERPGRRGGRRADRRPHACRDRAADRLLRQHRSCCAPTCRATRRSASSWAACDGPPWTPTRTRTLPFELLVEKLQPERDPSRNPIFQVTLQLFDQPRRRTGERSSRAAPPVAGERGTAIFDLALHVDRARWRPDREGRVQQRALRRGDGRAHGGAVRGAAACGGRRAGSALLAAAADLDGGAAAAAGGARRKRGALPARRLGRRARRGPGRPDARPPGRDRGRAADQLPASWTGARTASPITCGATASARTTSSASASSALRSSWWRCSRS